jgi:outer membrane protein assembly factor BamB
MRNFNALRPMLAIAFTALAAAAFPAGAGAISWKQSGFSAAETHNNPYETALSAATIPRLSSDCAGFDENVQYDNGDPGEEGSTVVAAGYVWLTDGTRMHAYNARTCEPWWWLERPGAAFRRSPAVVNGVVYLASTAGMWAFSVHGDFKWSAMQDTVFSSAPTVADGRVFVGAYDHNLYALDPATGALVWSRPTRGSILGAPAVSGGRVYVGSYDGKVRAFRAASGRPLWTTSLRPPDAPPRVQPRIFDAVAVAGGRVFVRADGGKVYALDAVHGQLLWQSDYGCCADTAPAVADGRVYIAGGDGVYALDAATGAGIWGDWGEGTYYRTPTVANGLVYLADSHGNLEVLDAGTGATRKYEPTVLRGNPPTEPSYLPAPAVVNGRVYMRGADDMLHAWSVHSPSPR